MKLDARLVIHSGSVGSGFRELEAEETRGLSSYRQASTEWGRRRDPTSFDFHLRLCLLLPFQHHNPGASTPTRGC